MLTACKFVDCNCRLSYKQWDIILEEFFKTFFGGGGLLYCTCNGWYVRCALLCYMCYLELKCAFIWNAGIEPEYSIYTLHNKYYYLLLRP